MQNRTDKELMAFITGKNTQALSVLYHRYERRIFNFVLRYTGSREIAQELIQETFTRIWTAAHTFDQKNGNFKGWLYTIALNITRSEMSKKEYTYHFIEVEDTRENHNPEVKNPETILEQTEMEHAVSNALGKLKPHLREVIVMKNYQHLKFREIAEVSNVPEGTLKARYHRAVALLKEYLNPTAGEANHV
ncbi:MAG: RNA polymerase sigma factor [bacterium]|nr:RNA polymerase sigma factor [bacterium]